MILLIIKVLMMLLPTVIEAVRDGRIKRAQQDEILKVLFDKIDARIQAAIRAGEGPLPDENSDPNNRNNRRP